MEIIFHAHHAAISSRMEQRAEESIRKLVRRLGRTGDAVVRFEEDGPTRRVEVLLTAPRGQHLVVRGEGRSFGPALTSALDRLDARVARVKRTRKANARAHALRRRGAGGAGRGAGAPRRVASA